MSQNVLTAKRERFVGEYLIDLNATKAAERAGYKHPNVQGSQLLGMPAVRSRVSLAIEKRNKRMRADADWVIQHLETEATNLDNAASVRVKALELLGRHLGVFSTVSKTKEPLENFCFADV